MPLWDLFWTMLWFFLFVAWIWLFFVIIGDVFRSRDLSGGAKALWTLLIVFLPMLGIFIYLLIRGSDISERKEQFEIDRDQKTREYAAMRMPDDGSSSGGSSPAAEIDRLTSLRDSGVLTEDEYQAQRAKLEA